MDKNWISPDEQVALINKLVHKNDTLIVLGDVGNVDYIRKLKVGYKVLIMGNHDSGATNYKRKIEGPSLFMGTSDSEIDAKRNIIENFNRTHPNYSIKLYQTVLSSFGKNRYGSWGESDNRLFDEVYEGPLVISEKIILSHEPIDLPYMVNIHGHDHAGKFRNGKNLNVAANVCGYAPINLKDEIKNGLLSKVPTIHRVTIDNASKKPVHKKKENK